LPSVCLAAPLALENLLFVYETFEVPTSYCVLTSFGALKRITPVFCKEFL
jgi:hypothetical protein